MTVRYYQIIFFVMSYATAEKIPPKLYINDILIDSVTNLKKSRNREKTDNGTLTQTIFLWK